MSSLAPPIATYAICINCVFLHNFVAILGFFFQLGSSVVVGKCELNQCD